MLSSKTIANRRQRGFTLIELLTVIAIIGILAGIMFPVMNKIQRTARQAECGNILRQIQLANVSFSKENRGLYVPARKAGNGGTEYWFNNAELLERLEIQASSDAERASGEAWPDKMLCHESLSREIQTTYGYNVTGFSEGSEGSVSVWQVRGSRLVNPTSVIAFADAADSLIDQTGATRWNREEDGQVTRAIAYRHAGNANIVYWDAAMDVITREEAEESDRLWQLFKNTRN